MTFAVGAIVTDIEGTTSSIAFVKDVLFPYARARLDAFISARADDVAPILDEVRRLESDEALTPQRIVALLERWMDEDR